MRAFQLRLHLSLLSRICAAVFGGYALSALAASALALLWPGQRAEAVVMLSMLSFALYCAAVMWVFATPSATRAWAGLALAGLPCALLAWGLG